MLFVESRRSEHEVEGAARGALLERLQEKGLVPLIRTARLYCFELALLGPERVREMDKLLAAWAEAEGDAPYVSGDVFCFEDFALFLIFGDNEEATGGLRAGIVYRDDTAEPQQKLEAFCRNLQEALEASRGAGGNGAGGASKESHAGASLVGGFEWKRVEPGVADGFRRFASVRESDAAAASAQANGRAKAGATESERSRAADLLEDTETRRLLRRLLEAQGAGRNADLLVSAITTGGDAGAEPLLGRLSSGGLLRRDVVVSCRKQGRALFRLPSMEAFEMVTASNAMCSECGSSLADERVEELVTPTELAASVLKEGAWMAHRLRTLLASELGVPETEIALRQSPDDGEVHMMSNVGGEPFLFYLRDGDVSASHARRALDLEAETEAAHLVIITTGKIQDEARVRLREHARRRSLRGGALEVLLIEGLDAATAELRHAFERVSQRVLAKELYELDASLGLSVGYMLSARFRLMQKSGALKDLAASAAGALAGSL
ncbi:MAG TPA: hypothetical protein VGB73_07420 [Pyrinomonadaceae bacterium]|jgi:hypothetical protein